MTSFSVILCFKGFSQRCLRPSSKGCVSPGLPSPGWRSPASPLSSQDAPWPAGRMATRGYQTCVCMCVCVSMFCFEQRETSQAKSVLMDLEGCFGDAFDWTQVQSCGIMYRSLRNNGCSMTCGNILSHAKAQVAAFRNFVGEKLCVFKIGVTANPLMRFPSYIDQGFTFMWVVAESCSKGLIHMLEAALISEFAACSGCRNKLGSGGEGALNRTTAALPPFYVYVAGGRADQNRRVG